MSIVVFYDRKTGDIIKVDPHPEWGEREVRIPYYRAHPGAWPEGAGCLTVPPEIEWDGVPENWIVVRDEFGNPKLIRREEWEAEQEIEREKERTLLLLIQDRLSERAKKKCQERLNRLNTHEKR